MIKIGSNYLSLKNTSVEDFIRVAYDLRLDCVDFHQRAFESTDPAYLGSVKALCLQYGLPIGYIGVSGLFHGTAAERQEQIETFGRATDLAAFLGSPIIRAFCANVPQNNGDGEETWPSMVAGYQAVADYAATKGIAVGLQNHPSTGDEMLRIRSDVDRGNFHLWRRHAHSADQNIFQGGVKPGGARHSHEQYADAGNELQRFDGDHRWMPSRRKADY